MAIIARKNKVLIGKAQKMFNDMVENIQACEDEDLLDLYLSSSECVEIVCICEDVIPGWITGGWAPSLEERIETKRKELNDGTYS